MADEIIRLIEWILGHEIVRAAIWIYAIIFLVILGAAITIIVTVFRKIKKHKESMNSKFGKWR